MYPSSSPLTPVIPIVPSLPHIVLRIFAYSASNKHNPTTCTPLIGQKTMLIIDERTRLAEELIKGSE